MRSAMIRAAVSVEPPGGKGTIRVMGRFGKGWACADAIMPSASATQTSKRRMKSPRFYILSQRRRDVAAVDCRDIRGGFQRQRLRHKGLRDVVGGDLALQQ